MSSSEYLVVSTTEIPVNPTPPAHAHLDGALVRGLAWTAGMKWGAQIFAWASTLIVARLLNPDDYGLVGMATVYLGFANLISEFGVGTTVITLRDLTEQDIAQLNGFAVLLGVAGFLLSCAAAVPLGIFFKSPRLPWVVVAMSATFIISSFQSVPAALLQRDLNFKFISVIDGVKGFSMALVAVLFALAGFRYWTLVLAGVSSAVVGTTLVLSKRRHRIAMPRPRTLSHVLRFSWHILGSRFSWYTYSNSDFVVSGRILGQQALGSYSVAWNLATVPVEKITGILNSVTPALYSAVQNDKPALRRYMLTLLEGIGLITLPLSVGVGLVSREFVLVFLGSKWASAILPLMFLGFYASIRSLIPIIWAVLNVVGDSGFAMRSSMVMAVILPAAFLLGSHWGNAGIAAAWMIGFPIVAIPVTTRAFRRIQLKWQEFFRVMLPSIAGCLTMAVAVVAMKAMLPARQGMPLRLALLVVTGGVAYVLVAGGLSYSRRHALQHAIQLLRNRRTAGAI
jgi:O-antigen/teichoic acid export membrane protein